MGTVTVPALPARVNMHPKYCPADHRTSPRQTAESRITKTTLESGRIRVRVDNIPHAMRLRIRTRVMIMTLMIMSLMIMSLMIMSLTV